MKFVSFIFPIHYFILDSFYR